MSAIKAGDLVQVIAACPCGYTKFLGHVFTVESIVQGEVQCNGCGRNYGIAKGAIRADRGGYYLLRYLKKIDPPSTPEHVEHREELTA